MTGEGAVDQNGERGRLASIGRNAGVGSLVPFAPDGRIAPPRAAGG